MTAREQGFLLLTSELGVPGRKTLTTAQLRTLAKRVQQSQWQGGDRDLTLDDLISLGYSRELAQRILVLLEDGELLNYYCQKGRQQACYSLSRVTSVYPDVLRQKLGWEAPGCLWYKGNLGILNMPKIALVGSRELNEENQRFAEEVGRQAALQGYVLVSGNARGADKAAQFACLHHGGKVISVVADSLAQRTQRENVLYLSEDDFDAPFSAQRAISRNRVIHSLGQMTFVAQSGYETGGTWDGTVKNLRFGWSPVYVYADGSPAQCVLADMGAQPVNFSQLSNFLTLPAPVADLFTNGGNTHEQSR